MSSPNRQLRRAAEAKARKAGGGAAQTEAAGERAVFQRMYNQQVMQLAQLEQVVGYYKALALAIMVEQDLSEITLGVDTMQIMNTGIVEDIEREINPDGTVLLTLVHQAGELGNDNDDDEVADEDGGEGG